MTHKERCNELKGIRKQLADKLGIDLHQTECKFKGECKGTCPRCAQEEKTLNMALLGKTAAFAGLMVSSMSLTGCDVNDFFPFVDKGNPNATTESTTEESTEEDLAGEVEYYPEDLTTEITTAEATTEDDRTTEEIIQLDGDVAYDPSEYEVEADANYSDEEIMEACKKTCNAENADIIDNYMNVLTVYCYNTEDRGDGDIKPIDAGVFYVNNVDGTATDKEGNSVDIWQ